MAAQPAGRRYPFLVRRLEEEPEYRARVEAAVGLGIPPSQLDGREPATETEYEYDDAGRLVRSITRSEPRWTDQDRAEVLAHHLRQASFCPCGCGQKTADSLSDERTGPQFRAQRTACRARMALIDAQDEAAKAPSPYAQARVWAVEKIGR